MYYFQKFYETQIIRSNFVKLVENETQIGRIQTPIITHCSRLSGLLEPTTNLPKNLEFIAV